MANLKEVKGRIKTVQSTQQITKAMKMVAAAKLRRSQDNIIQLRPYAQKLNAILQNLSSGNDEGSQNEFADVREENKVLVVAVTSDKGLCGPFNSNVFKAVKRVIEEKYGSQYGQGNLDIMPIGKKAYEYYKKRGYQLVDDFWGVFTGISYEKVEKAGEFVLDAFKQRRYDKVEIVYNEFKNVATQILRTEQFLPVLPVEGEGAGQSGNAIDYIFQPTQEAIVTSLIPQSLKVQLYKAVLESNAAEHGARMTAMDKATDNAGELLKELKLTYNRTRQAAITKEILEIVGGAEALG